MQEQTETAIELADALMFVVDARAGLTPTDRAFGVAYGLDDIDPPRATSLPALLAMPFQFGDSVASHPVGSSDLPQAT